MLATCTCDVNATRELHPDAGGGHGGLMLRVASRGVLYRRRLVGATLCGALADLAVYILSFDEASG